MLSFFFFKPRLLMLNKLWFLFLCLENVMFVACYSVTLREAYGPVGLAVY